MLTTVWSCCVRTSHLRRPPLTQAGVLIALGLALSSKSRIMDWGLIVFMEESSRPWAAAQDQENSTLSEKSAMWHVLLCTDRALAIPLYTSKICKSLHTAFTSQCQNDCCKDILFWGFENCIGSFSEYMCDLKWCKSEVWMNDYQDEVMWCIQSFCSSTLRSWTFVSSWSQALAGRWLRMCQLWFCQLLSKLHSSERGSDMCQEESNTQRTKRQVLMEVFSESEQVGFFTAFSHWQENLKTLCCSRTLEV